MGLHRRTARRDEKPRDGRSVEACCIGSKRRRVRRTARRKRPTRGNATFTSFRRKRRRTRRARRSKGGLRGSLPADLIEPEAPKAKRYIVNDTSYEALGEIDGGQP